MRIIIDARLYGTRHRGLGRYIKQLITHLGLIDKTNHYILLVDPRHPELPAKIANQELQAAPWQQYSWAEQIKLPRLLNKIPADIIHFPHFNVPLLRLNKPFVVTIHDLIINHFPYTRATTLPLPLYQLKLLAYRQVIKHAIDKAKHIITVSNSVLTDVANYYPSAANKISVVYPGLNQLPPALANLTLPALYFLVVGAAYPHKNLEILLRSFTAAAKTIPGYALVIVGRKDFFMRRLEQYASGLTLKDKIIFWGEASDAELAALYQKAQGYILPSLAEGFGFGPLEALTNGIPAIVSDIPVLHEILGDRVIYFNPHSVTELTKAIEQLSRQPSPHANTADQLRQRYNWLKTASATLILYKKSAGIIS